MIRTLLQQGRVIDPENQRDEVCDVLVEDGKITNIGQLLNTDSCSNVEVIDCRNRLVLPGLIDTHSHIYQYVSGRFGLNPDMCGVHSGVTTLVDQGGASCITIPGFRHFIVEPSASRVISFISAYLVGGLEGHYYPELYRPECTDISATVNAIENNRDIVKGIKAHAELGGFSRWGVEVMERAAEIGKRADLPVYIHFGQLWPMPEDGGCPVDPDSILQDVAKLLKPGDVLAHPFSRHKGGFVTTAGDIHPFVQKAVEIGLKVDVGHGSHFSFNTARTVLGAGIIPNTLGSDMHGYNTEVPPPPGTPSEHPDEEHLFTGTSRFSLVSAMVSLMALGLSLEEVIPMATINAARMINMDDKIGTLGIGRGADITVLSDEIGRWSLQDNDGTEVTAKRMLEPLFCLRDGVRYDATSSILPIAKRA